MLVLGIPGDRVRHTLGEWARRDYPDLCPAPTEFEVTVRDVTDAPDDERFDVVHRWAASTWASWSSHHDAVREWLEYFGVSG